jgi:hypothetical protein
MRRHLFGIGLAVLLGSAAMSAAHAQALRILSPGPDQTVREEVPITIPASVVPRRGYAVVQLDGKFLAAVGKPRTGTKLTYLWNTKGRKDEERVKDGQHQIRVQAVDADTNQPVGGAQTVTVFVRNTVGRAPASVTLAYKYSPTQTQAYTTTVKVTQAGLPLYTAWLLVTREVDDISYETNPSGEAVVREVIDPTSAENLSGQLTTFYKAGTYNRFYFSSTGASRLGAETIRRLQKTRQAAPEPSLPFLPMASTARRVGSEWPYPMRLVPWYNHIDSLPIAAATHKLEGFEWQSGRATAKIVSKFDAPSSTLVEGQLQRFLLKGQRVTYFDWQNGRVVRQEDTFTLDTQDTTATVPTTGGVVSPNTPSFNNPAATTGADLANTASANQVNVEVITQMVR